MKKPKFISVNTVKADSVVNGAAVKQYRLSLGVTGQAVAGEMRLDPSTITYYEQGKRTVHEDIFKNYLAAVEAIAARKK